MTIPKEAIEKAIEGGWRPTFLSLPQLHPDRDWQHITFDPTFWEALIIGEKWSESRDMFGDWFYYAHHFYDLILQNKPTDDFWQEILK